ncbi:hypothetical protein [Nesterenkonia sp.]|uniref:hypothetical protein n=1 Tax=Nesterenkonia sp. TaxID=704201 RepID=UPI002638BAB2|nr:hypothetical protein [Nesterenkonia sp.]
MTPRRNEREPQRQSLSDSVAEPAPKPPLGRPHDAWATVCLTVSVAALFLFFGRMASQLDW